METFLAVINTIVLCVIMLCIIILIIRHASAQIQVSQLEYWIYKPLFPFVLAEDDPLSIKMPHKHLVVGEAI